MTDLDALDVPAVLFVISKEWAPGMDEDEIYDAVRGWWRLGPKRELAEYALAVAEGRVRGVFRVLEWRPRRKGDRHWEHDEPDKPRWGFDGEPAPELEHLLGLDVRPLFPPGAANPVRYVNCDGPAPSRADSALALPVPVTDPLERVCERLRRDPLLHLSSHSKELFHSNVLAWLFEAYPELMAEAVHPWLEPDPGQQEHRVRREWLHLDLVVWLPGFRPLVVENKVFSLPDEAQLDRYDAALDRQGLQASRVLLSVARPGWDERNGWRFLPFELVRKLAAFLSARLHEVDPFTGELLDRYGAFVGDLLELVVLTAVQREDEPVALDADRVAVLQTVRLHDALQKLRARTLVEQLHEEYRRRGLVVAWTEAGLTNGSVLMTTAVRTADGEEIGWQLQGGQWRRFLLTRRPELVGKTEPLRHARAHHAASRFGAWFDFGAEQRLGPFQEGPAGGFNHYAPDFVYRYVKVPGLTVAELRQLAVDVVEQAERWR